MESKTLVMVTAHGWESEFVALSPSRAIFLSQFLYV